MHPYSSDEEEHMEECSSLKALPPTDHSISEITMMSQESCQEDDEIGDEMLTVNAKLLD